MAFMTGLWQDRNIQKWRKFYDKIWSCWTSVVVGLIQAWSIDLHLAHSQELFPVWEDDVNVATVHSITLETNRIPSWDVRDHGASDRQEWSSHVFIETFLLMPSVENWYQMCQKYN